MIPILRYSSSFYNSPQCMLSFRIAILPALLSQASVALGTLSPFADVALEWHYKRLKAAQHHSRPVTGSEAVARPCIAIPNRRPWTKMMAQVISLQLRADLRTAMDHIFEEANLLSIIEPDHGILYWTSATRPTAKKHHQVPRFGFDWRYGYSSI